MAPPRLTIHDMAVDIRHRAFRDIGEDEWARYCMWFEQELPTLAGPLEFDNRAEQLKAVYQLLARDEDARDTQLALCWLDSKGYGATTLEELKQKLADFRSKNPD